MDSTNEGRDTPTREDGMSEQTRERTMMETCKACGGSGVVVKKRPKGAVGPKESRFACPCTWRFAGGYRGQNDEAAR